jgi:hypothetical protein
MFDELHNQCAQRPDGTDAPGATIPDAEGAGRAQRSETERSDGSRSGARPAPSASPPSMPPPTPQNQADHGEYDEAETEGDEIPTDPAEDPERRPRFFHGGSSGVPSLSGRGKRGRRLVKPADTKVSPLSAEQRLLLLDTWQRSGLPAGDFAAMVGLSKHTLYGWKKKFDAEGPAGLMDQPRGAPRGSRLPDLTKRSILMLKQANPDWGCQKISDMLLRGPASRPAPRRSPRSCTRPATNSRKSPPGLTPTRSATSSGPVPTSSGKLICSRSC